MASVQIEGSRRAERIVEHLRCPSCGDASLRSVAAPERWVDGGSFEALRGALGLSGCNGCGLVFTNPRPADEVLATYYAGILLPRRNADGPFGSSDAPISEKSAVLLDVIARHVPTGTLLDYGCTEGMLLRAAVARGWRAFGFDLGAALRRCRARGLLVTDRLDDFAENTFDVVVLNQVMEHVARPEALLARLKRLVSDRGKIVVQCPNVRSLRARIAHPLLARRFGLEERYRAFPIHLAYFDRTTLPALLTAAGFHVEHVGTFGVGFDALFAETSADADDDEPAAAAPIAVAPPADSVVRRVKELGKAAFCRLGLGEHVVVVASAARP